MYLLNIVPVSLTVPRIIHEKENFAFYQEVVPPFTKFNTKKELRCIRLDFLSSHTKFHNSPNFRDRKLPFESRSVSKRYAAEVFRQVESKQASPYRKQPVTA